MSTETVPGPSPATALRAGPRRAVIESTLVAALLLTMTVGCGSVEDGQSSGFATWRSEEPDTLASIWLIESYLFPGERVRILPPGANPGDHISFAVPGGKYTRAGEYTAFAALLQAHEVDDPVLWRLNEIVNLIEISPWRKTADREALVVEALMREVQHRFPGSIPCAVGFYDALYEALSADAVATLEQSLWSSDSAFLRCDEGGAVRPGDHAVATVPIESLLQAVADGKDVRFIDTRETAEYHHGRIPGAINLKLRDLDDEAFDALRGADLVVPYCVKDFRGYEVARVLANAGLGSVAIMSPHGIAGWRQLGLPVAEGAPEAMQQEYAQLRACAGTVARCGYDGGEADLALTRGRNGQ